MEFQSVVLLIVCAFSVVPSQSSETGVRLTTTLEINLTCTVPSALQDSSKVVVQLGMWYTTQRGYARSLLNVSRQEYYPDLQVGDLPALAEWDGQHNQSNPSRPFLTLTFPLTEDASGQYSCITTYMVEGEAKTKRMSIFIGWPGMAQEGKRSDGITADFTPVVRVKMAWFEKDLKPHMKVYSSPSISESLENVESTRCQVTCTLPVKSSSCSSVHPDVLRFNVSYLNYTAGKEHIFTLDFYIRNGSSCRYFTFTVNVKTNERQENIHFEAHVSLPPLPTLSCDLPRWVKVVIAVLILLILLILLIILIVGLLIKKKRNVPREYNSIPLDLPPDEQTSEDVPSQSPTTARINSYQTGSVSQGLPSGQTGSVGQGLPSGQTESGGQGLPSGQTGSVSQGLPSGQTESGGQGLPSGQTGSVRQGLPSGQTGSVGQGLPSGQTGSVNQGLPSGQTGSDSQGLPSGQTGSDSQGLPSGQTESVNQGLPSGQTGSDSQGLPSGQTRFSGQQQLSSQEEPEDQSVAAGRLRPGDEALPGTDIELNAAPARGGGIPCKRGDV